MAGKDDLDEYLRGEALTLGVDYFGVADLSVAGEAVHEQGGDMLAQFPRAVSVGVVMPSAIVDQLSRHTDRRVALAYRSHSYEILNRRLDEIASRLASTLQREGCRAFPVAAPQAVDRERLLGLFSHKLAAHLAGLGWIGKSCLLVTTRLLNCL
jgi:epoxyqueuosine reductase